MEEFYSKKNCDRCGAALDGRTLSVMNMDVICLDCKDVETLHPKYSEAAKRELQEVLKGNTNYEGLFAGQVYPFE